MATILHINSSVRNTGSISRQLTAEFLSKWQAVQPADMIVERDLAANPVPHLTEQMMGAFFTPAEQRSPEQAQTVQLSDDLVAELLSADTIVLGAPMYNFSVSSTLKAWIDHVARAGLTFKYTETGPVGMVQGKKVYIFTSRGGVYSQGPAKSMDFHETYLRAVLGFIGLTDITFIHTEGLAMGDAAVADALTQTRQAIGELVAA
ncbi:FMN-dependent NADH-azoreductase [Undibacterium arcticum]|uniref:FMN dependent NADH:quinone oxidoreductase n=1 Tax=Undibacterium arcticum TaxID=1762892 RepID=A0ABV7EUD0_9BURK